VSGSFDFKAPDLFTAGTVGPPGQRVFYLQAREAGALATLKVEKEQVGALAEHLAEFLQKVPGRAGESQPTGDLVLVEPLVVAWAVGSIGVGYDEPVDRVVVAQRIVMGEREPPGVRGEGVVHGRLGGRVAPVDLFGILLRRVLGIVDHEIGALEGVRLLKNLAGAWLVERCRPAWGDPPIADLMAAAATVDGPERVLDVADPRFLNPDDMLAAVTADLGLPAAAPPPVVVRGIVESQVAGTAAVLRELGGVTDVHVFGGAQSALYRRLLAERTGLPVCSGPVEATALGNALVQGIALGVYDDLADARRHLADPWAGAS